MGKCIECGNELEDNGKFCSNCGAEVNKKTSEKINPYTGYPETKEESPNQKAINWGWIGVLLFVPAGFVISLYLISQEDKKAKKNGWWMLGICIIWAYILFILLPNYI